MKRVLVLGIDGYIGYTLALHLLKNGYEVAGLDNYSRRRWVKKLGGDSLTPIATPRARDQYLRSFENFIDQTSCINLKDYFLISRILDSYRPDTIVHLAEQPSAPYSMLSANACIETQQENTIGTLALLWAIREKCPDAHLIKIGSMGEYGTPNCPIPEGIIPEKCLGTPSLSCPMSGLLFPRQPGSFYHLSKVHDTYNIDFACRTWGIRATDIQQGVVFGCNASSNETELTRFDYDECFGTVINRFCVQALIGTPLTIYGKGTHVRSILPLKDSIQCLNLAIDYPAEPGEYRNLNQYGEYYDINTMATMVMDAAANYDIEPDYQHLESPRTEALRHIYEPINSNLINLGYKPTDDMIGAITELIGNIRPYVTRVIPHTIAPKTQWR